MNFPILSTLIFLPLVSSFFIFLSRDKTNNNSSIYISLFSSFATFLLSIFLWYSLDLSTSEFQFVEEKSWINDFIKFKLGIDGISILFIVLTTFITPICIISCVNSVKVRVKEFLIAILILETFMIGVFCSLDLVIFYLFFEAGLIPMFLIIGVWGGPRRVYSAFKFFLFTLLGSVLMLVAIIVIYWLTGTTDITQIYEIKISKEYQNILWLAFFSSFAVKMPMWPVHTWLPDAHVEAPTAGSVILDTYVPNSIRIFYTFCFYFKYNCDYLHFFSCSNARRYEKINCILFCGTYGLCNSRYFYINKTRY